MHSILLRVDFLGPASSLGYNSNFFRVSSLHFDLAQVTPLAIRETIEPFLS